MKTFKLDNWLPTTKKEVEARGWDYLDVILFSGDAYVDHPSFGAAVIGRVLEAEGLREAGRSPAFLRCIRRCHGFNDQPLYCQ